MVDFKSLFRFSQKEVSCLFEHSTLKQNWRGLKLLQAPLKCLSENDCSEQKLKSSEKTICDNNKKVGKILIITPSACGNACQRNRLRRRVKSIFYSKKFYLNPVVSILIIHKNAMNLDFDQISKFLEKNLAQDLSLVELQDQV